MSTTDFARNEFERAEIADSPLARDVLELLAVFDQQRHNDPSGVIEVFTRLAAGMPMLPLTGEDDEWLDIFQGTQQNKRCPNVFRDRKTGIAYDMMAYVFENPITGARMVADQSRADITFPYFPRTRIVQMTPPGSDHETPLPVIPPQERGE